MRIHILALGATLLLAGCVPAPRATAPAGEDLCGPQLVVFVNSADLLSQPPRRAGLPSAEELAAELERENAALERMQIAFDALLYCRWTEVRLIRADAATGPAARAALPARLASAEARMRRDLTRAGTARGAIDQRAARLEATLEQVSPGSRAALRAARPAVPRAVASAPVVLRLRPEPDAPPAGRVAAGTEAILRPAPGGFALIDAGPQLRGYAPSGAFTLLPAPAPFAADRLRSLAATNIARRETFTEALNMAERGLPQGFERGI